MSLNIFHDNSPLNFFFDIIFSCYFFISFTELQEFFVNIILCQICWKFFSPETGVFDRRCKRIQLGVFIKTLPDCYKSACPLLIIEV